MSCRSDSVLHIVPETPCANGPHGIRPSAGSLCSACPGTSGRMPFGRWSMVVPPVRAQVPHPAGGLQRGIPSRCRGRAGITPGPASWGSPARRASLPSCADRKPGVLLLWRTRPPCPIRTDQRPQGCVPSRRGPSSCICATAHRCCPGRHHGAVPCKMPAPPA